jgi:hypothetical protein
MQEWQYFSIGDIDSLMVKNDIRSTAEQGLRMSRNGALEPIEMVTRETSNGFLLKVGAPAAS